MHKLTIFRRIIGVKTQGKLTTPDRLRTRTSTDSSVQALTYDLGLEKSFSREKKKDRFLSVSLKVKVFCITELRSRR